MLYQYNKIEFEVEDEKLFCNLCNCELQTKKCKRQTTKKHYFRILKCSNDTCKCNSKIKRYEKIKAILPVEIFKERMVENLNNWKNNNHLRKEYWLKKGLTESEATKEISKIQSKNNKLVKNKVKRSKELMKKKGYSDEEIRLACLTPSTYEFWVKKGYSLIEAKKLVFENQSKASLSIDRSCVIYPTSKQYYIEKYNCSDKEAEKMLKKFQTKFSKEICIQKYGEINGIKKWKERQKKWLKSYKKSNFSKISQVLFWELYHNLSDKENVFFATNNKGEKSDNNQNFEFRLNLNESYILPDFFIKNKNKIIEFDGTYYHRNTSENKKREIERDKNIIDSGFVVFHVSEKDFKNNKEDVINNCLNFINND